MSALRDLESASVLIECPECGPMYAHLSGRIRIDRKFPCECCGTFCPFRLVPDPTPEEFARHRKAAILTAINKNRLMESADYLRGDLL